MISLLSRAIAMSILLALWSGGAAANDTRLAAAPGSSIQLKGSSNVAKWQCRGTAIAVTMTVAAPIEKINDVINRIENGDIAPWMSNPAAGRLPQPDLHVAIPISALRCTGGAPMERDLARTLKADLFPDMVFRFEGLGSGVTHDIDRGHFRATVTGGLSLAGVSHDLSFTAVVRRISPTRFHLTATLPARMTDFGLSPPTALFGMIKASNDLSVEFDLIMEVDQ